MRRQEERARRSTGRTSETEGRDEKPGGAGNDAGKRLPPTCELANLPTCQLATILYVVLYLLCLFMD